MAFPDMRFRRPGAALALTGLLLLAACDAAEESGAQSARSEPPQRTRAERWTWRKTAGS